ncbi:hypothetical protein Syun_016800 [Stephania yunnanensis]|uniref:non-specific serine/threonine protein kinase n=1 Tax=Stephania yunnanensis TaxID=152371 RepID=A0AAP0P2H5_9MAGN
MLARLTCSRTRVYHHRRQHSLAIAIVGVAKLGFKPSSPPPPTLLSPPSSPNLLSLAGTIDLKTSCPICKFRCSKDLYVGRAQTKAEREQMIPRQVEERKKEQLQKYEDLCGHWRFGVDDQRTSGIHWLAEIHNAITESCVLKVNMHCDGCKQDVKKLLQKIEGTLLCSSSQLLDPVIRGNLLLTCTNDYIALLLLAASFAGALQVCLDFLLFDQSRSTSLDWAMRRDIIIGIARGVLYLHQGSRLRIVHRDLKASNVLLRRRDESKVF